MTDECCDSYQLKLQRPGRPITQPATSAPNPRLVSRIRPRRLVWRHEVENVVAVPRRRLWRILEPDRSSGHCSNHVRGSCREYVRANHRALQGGLKATEGHASASI